MRKVSLCLAILLSAACAKSGSVWLEVRNASDEPLRNLALDYGKGAFTHPYFRPGLTFGAWIRVTRRQPLILTYTNSSGGRQIPLETALTRDMISGSLLIKVRGDGLIDETFTPWSGHGPDGSDWLENHYPWVAGVLLLLLLPTFMRPILLWLAGLARRPEVEVPPSNPVLEQAAARLGMSHCPCPVLYDQATGEPFMWWQGKSGGHTIGLLDSGMIWVGESGEKTLGIFERSAPGGPFNTRDLTVREVTATERKSPVKDPVAARLVSELSINVSVVSVLADAVEAAVAWDTYSADLIIADVRVLSALKSRVEELDPPLVRAVMRGRETAALAMIKTMTNFEDLTIGGLNAMTAAAAAGRTEMVLALLAAGASARTERGFPLHAAARAGHAETAKALLDAGALLDGRDERECTPLIEAAGAGHQEVVALLLARGADASALDAEQATALAHAEAEGFTEVAAALRAAGAGS
jgi:hypothetical protein